MRKSLVPVSLVLLLAAETGCNHKQPVAVTPPTVPLLQPTATLKDFPALPPVVMPPVQLGTQEAQEAPPREKPHRPHTLHHHPRPAANPSQDIPAETPSASAAPAPAAASAGQEPPESTPIGQLSAAPNATDVPNRQNIQQEISSTESGLNGIHRSLSGDEQQTASEIRTFLSKAKNALQSGDLDGAHTLTVKARVLLAELNK
jgi:hypothetical protein